MEEEVERLKKEIERLKNEKKEEGRLVFKVSDKGCLSVYGLNRFPVSLYKDQWIKLLDNSSEIRKFITENENTLATK